MVCRATQYHFVIIKWVLQRTLLLCWQIFFDYLRLRPLFCYRFVVCFNKFSFLQKLFTKSQSTNIVKVAPFDVIFSLRSSSCEKSDVKNVFTAVAVPCEWCATFITLHLMLLSMRKFTKKSGKFFISNKIFGKAFSLQKTFFAPFLRFYFI